MERNVSRAHVDVGIVEHREYDATVSIDDEDEETPDPNSPIEFRFSWKKLWRFAGPGWLMSLAYLDPGNVRRCHSNRRIPTLRTVPVAMHRIIDRP